MWREWTMLAALPLGLAMAVVAAPALRRALGSLAGAAALGIAAGAVVWLVSSVPFAALVAGAMAFAFALLGSGSVGRWVSRASSPAPDGADRSRRSGRGGASGSW